MSGTMMRAFVRSEERKQWILPTVSAPEADRGMGLISMRERAELVGGELHVRPRAGGGTRVHLVVPKYTGESPARDEVA